MPRMRFDPVLNWGHILTVIAIVGSVITVYVKLVGAIDRNDYRLTVIEQRAPIDQQFQMRVLDKLTSIREDIAKLDERSKAKN